MLLRPIQILILTITFFYSLDAVAQKENDSLAYYKLQLKQIESKSISVDSVIYLYNKAKQFSDVVETIVLTRYEALYLNKNGLKDITLSKCREAIRLAQDNELNVLEGLVYVDLSNYYYSFHQTKLAYKTLLRAKTLLTNLSATDISLYNSTADEFLTQEQMLDPVINNLGAMAIDYGDYVEAEKYFNQSYSFANKRNDKQGIIDVKINLANLLLEKGENEKSNHALFELLNDSIALKSDLILIQYNISVNYFRLNKFHQAIKHIDEAIAINEIVADETLTVDLFYLKAKVLSSFQKYDEAKALLQESIKRSLKINDFNFLLDLYSEMAKIERSTNNPKKANLYYKKLLAVQDSIKAHEQQGSYEEILLENKLYNQELINARQEKDFFVANERISLYVKLNLVGALSFIILGLLFYLYRENSEKRTRLIRQSSKIKEIELESKRKSESHETERIHEELKAKKRELLLAILFTKKRKEKLKIISQKIDQVAQNSVITKAHLMAIKDFVIEKSKELDGEENVQQLIVSTHKDFFSKLLEEYPNLTQTELKILAYLRVGMNTKEIANVQNVSIDAVRKMRYRIRKKLKLEAKQSLEKFILQYH